MGNEIKRPKFTSKAAGDYYSNLDPSIQAGLNVIGNIVPVSSTFRTPEHNKNVGGVANSKHLTGEAFDIPTAGLTQDVLNKVGQEFSANDYKYIDEGDHIHVEKIAKTQPQFNENDFEPVTDKPKLPQFNPADFETVAAQELPQFNENDFEPAAPKTSFIQRLLQPPKEAQKSSIPLIDRFKQSFGNFETRPETPSALPGMLALGVPGSLGVSNLFNAATDGPQRSTLNEIQQFSGEIPGMLAELPADLLKSVTGGTRVAHEVGKKLGTYQNDDNSYFNDPEVLRNDIAGALPFVLPALAKIKGASTRNGFLGDLLRSGKELKQAAVDRVPIVGDVLKARKLKNYNLKLSDVGPITTNSADRAGASAGQQIIDIGNKNSTAYNKFNDALYSKFGETNQSVESVRKLLADKINALNDTVVAGNSKLKTLRKNLLEQQTALSKNPTLSQMKEILAGFGDSAKFGSTGRDGTDRYYEKLYKAMRKDVISGFDNAVTEAGTKTSTYKQVSKANNILLDEQNILNDKAKSNPLWVDSKSGASQVKQPNWAKRTGAERVVSAQKENLTQVADVYDLLKKLDTANAEEGKAIAEEINRRRKDIAKIIDVKRGPLGKLSKQNGADVVTRGASTGKLSIKRGGVDKILDADSAYKDPIKEIVIADIKRMSESPEKLAKAMDKYKEVLPSLLSEKEMISLQKLAGTYRSSTQNTLPNNVKAMVPFLNQLLNKNTQ